MCIAPNSPPKISTKDDILCTAQNDSFNIYLFKLLQNWENDKYCLGRFKIWKQVADTGCT